MESVANIAKSECLYQFDFTTISTLAFDLSANIQITNDILSLINYRAHSFPKQIIFNPNFESQHALIQGVGSLPLKLNHKGVETFVLVKNVGFDPQACENILSANLFSLQFNASILMEIKSGLILRKTTRTKLAKLEVRNHICTIYLRIESV